ncbi:D-tyrosyl-tRNA deacylase [Gorgonomyces haynaldii]|nr:D-tyrosyl-tRNA deacylase [Gorgonomyces haynaldii]
MRALIQRVTRGSVTVDNQTISSIGKGLVCLIGIEATDTQEDADYLCRKITSLRLFPQDQQQWKHSVTDIQGEILLVSQFTLYAKTKKGTKPDFHLAMGGDQSKAFYLAFVEQVRQAFQPDRVKDGQFGAMMEVEIINDGPVTIWIDSRDK